MRCKCIPVNIFSHPWPHPRPLVTITVMFSSSVFGFVLLFPHMRILYNIWCISLGMLISSRSICIVENGRISFFSRLSRSPLSMYVCFYSLYPLTGVLVASTSLLLWTIINGKCSYLFNDLFLFLLELEDDIDWDYNLSVPCPSPATRPWSYH